jgi:hypothetical protein
MIALKMRDGDEYLPAGGQSSIGRVSFYARVLSNYRGICPLTNSKRA